MTPSSPLIGPGGADQAHAEDAGRAAGAALGLTGAGGGQELTRTEADVTLICVHGEFTLGDLYT